MHCQATDCIAGPKRTLCKCRGVRRSPRKSRSMFERMCQSSSRYALVSAVDFAAAPSQNALSLRDWYWSRLPRRDTNSAHRPQCLLYSGILAYCHGAADSIAGCAWPCMQPPSHQPCQDRGPMAMPRCTLRALPSPWVWTALLFA